MILTRKNCTLLSVLLVPSIEHVNYILALYTKGLLSSVKGENVLFTNPRVDQAAFSYDDTAIAAYYAKAFGKTRNVAVTHSLPMTDALEPCLDRIAIYLPTVRSASEGDGMLLSYATRWLEESQRNLRPTPLISGDLTQCVGFTANVTELIPATVGPHERVPQPWMGATKPSTTIPVDERYAAKL